MKFLPFENISFKTNLSQDEVKKRMSKNIEPFGSDWGRIFEGELKGNLFEIRRNIWYQSSFIPAIKGVIRNDGEKTFLQVEMKLPTLVLIFVCISFGFAFIIFLLFVMAGIFSGHFPIVALLPFGMMVFCYLLTMTSFKLECGKTKKELEKIIEGDIVY